MSSTNEEKYIPIYLVQVRFNEEEHKTLKEVAKLLSLSINSVVKSLSFQRAREILKQEDLILS